MRIPTVLVALSFLSTIPALAQQRGVGGDDPNAPTGVRRAVIIGISKYGKLAPEKQLEYASADAKEFADFLSSPAGGSVPSDRIQLLIDEKATAVAVALALFNLRKESQPGDEAIIYFSGHGDAETASGEDAGFLLASDAAPGAYTIGGAIGVSTLAAFVRGITDKGGRVLLITDLSRFGKLVGDRKGAQRTTAALLQTWDKVAKIVSSAPDQASFEGKQWGGGHGVFTYFLILGLQGLADRNDDGSVSLAELHSFVSERVSKETQGRQSPQVQGDMSQRLARVDPATKRAAHTMESRR